MSFHDTHKFKRMSQLRVLMHDIASLKWRHSNSCFVTQLHSTWPPLDGDIRQGLTTCGAFDHSRQARQSVSQSLNIGCCCCCSARAAWEHDGEQKAIQRNHRCCCSNDADIYDPTVSHRDLQSSHRTSISSFSHLSSKNDFFSSCLLLMINRDFTPTFLLTSECFQNGRWVCASLDRGLRNNT